MPLHHAFTFTTFLFLSLAQPLDQVQSLKYSADPRNKSLSPLQACQQHGHAGCTHSLLWGLMYISLWRGCDRMGLGNEQAASLWHCGTAECSRPKQHVMREWAGSEGRVFERMKQRLHFCNQPTCNCWEHTVANAVLQLQLHIDSTAVATAHSLKCTY